MPHAARLHRAALARRFAAPRRVHARGASRLVLRGLLLGDHVADVVVGTGNVGWMLALGAVMAIEKNAAWGKKLSRPLGFGLMTWAALIVAGNVAG
jgi:hypothetical protein